MTERTYRTRIEDLASVGEELREAHLRLVAGAAGKKNSGGHSEGTRTSIATYEDGGPWSGGLCVADSDFT